MKSPPWILNFLIIICLKAKIIAAFSMMNNVIINYEGLNIQFENAFKRGYGKDLLAIGNLKSDRIENMKPHLTAIVNTLPDNPLRTYFEYSRALCIDYPAIHKLNAITQNIYNFVAASKGISINSFMSIGGVRIVNNSIVSLGDAKLFIATSVRTDTENEIKSYFDKHEEAMRKAAEIREQALARAKRIQEQIAREREERSAREALLRQERYAREAKRREEKLREDREKLQRKLARDAEKREEDQKKAAAKREEEQRKAAAKRDEEQRKAAAKREKAPGRGPTIQQTPNAAQRQLQKNNSNNGYRLVNSKTVSKRMVVEEDDNDDDDDDDDDEDNDEDDDDNDDEDMF